jgi:hypothetical protein
LKHEAEKTIRRVSAHAFDAAELRAAKQVAEREIFARRLPVQVMPQNENRMDEMPAEYARCEVFASAVLSAAKKFAQQQPGGLFAQWLPVHSFRRSKRITQ